MESGWGVENKKAVKSNPGGTCTSFEDAAPHTGSEFDLTALLALEFHVLAGSDYTYFRK